jgi:hypothetical protein
MTMVVRHSPGSRRLTLSADKAYDVHEFVGDLRGLNITPHIARNTINRSSAIDARTTRHPGYAMSQQKRKRTEEPFGWGKTIGGLARPMLRGAARLRFKFILTMAAYDLSAAQITSGVRMTSGKINRPQRVQTPQLGAISRRGAAKARISGSC